MSATAEQQGDEHAEETRWVDASIRWDDHKDDANEDDSDEDGPMSFDPFKEDPSQTFSFRFARPGSTSADAFQRSTTCTGNADGAASGTAQGESNKNDDEKDDDNIYISLNGYKYDSDETFNSTGLTLWRAAEHLCHYMVRHPGMFQNKRIIELGCGLGLCGILAHLLTSEQLSNDTNSGNTCKNETAVYLTDGDTEALAALRTNVKHNQPKVSNSDNTGSISCHQLLWGRQSTINFLERYCDGQTFDVLLASDVVYVADIIQPLMESVQTLLCRHGVFLFAYCSRRNVPVKIDFVLSAVLEAGFKYECVEEVDGILIYAIRWRNSGTTNNGEKSAVEDEPIRPFEWLTNFDSLSSLLSQSNLFPIDEYSAAQNRPRMHALHVGCGTSTLGECLVEQLGYAEVVNADIDREALVAMEKRWLERRANMNVQENDDLGTMDWQHFDFSKMGVASSDSAFRSGYFDVVVDKSTLDCALCADDGAAGLIVDAYNALRPDGGIYFVISFHHVDFVMPLLRDCPGTDWDVEHIVVKRKVDVPEHLAGRIIGITGDPVEDPHDVSVKATQTKESAWSDGSFQPDSEYRRTCNVFICRRGKNSSNGDSISFSSLIYFDAVRDHLHKISDEWFKKSNPMVTHTRESDLRAAFSERLDVHNKEVPYSLLPLRDCYDILFTDAEREHLSYEYFLEDWNAFHEKHACISEHEMNVETALLFLKEMQ